MEQTQSFQQMVPEQPHAKKSNLDIDRTPFIKINAELIIDLNVKCKTIKPLNDSIGET